jgi:hypothetical protein
MEHSLQIYIHDHLAGARFGTELLQKLKDVYADHEAGALAASILSEVQEDVETLQQIRDQVGKSTIDLKDSIGWLAERASRAKLRHDDPEGIGAFEAFEMLSLGVLGKGALWRALQTVAGSDARLIGYDYAELAERAQSQFERLEAFRLRLSIRALSDS